MNKLNIALGVTALIAGILVATSTSARSQDAKGPDTPIKLQTATPGVPQVGHGNISGTFKATYLKGNGLGVTGVNANNIAVGTLSDDRLSVNVPLLNQGNTFSGAGNFLGYVGIGGYSNAGSKLTVHNGSVVVVQDNTNVAVRVGLEIGAGTVTTSGSDGGICYLNSVGPTDNPRGKIAVAASGQSDQAGMYVDGTNNGIIYGDVKNFRVPNPKNAAEDIVYASIEGPEAAAYDRGTIHLVNGHAWVGLPAHFRDVTVSEGMTVQLTPCSRDSEGLAVENRSNAGFDIYELRSGKGSYDVDWQVMCARHMHEDYSPIRKWDETIGEGADKKQAWSKRMASIQSKEAAYAAKRVARP